MSGSRQKKLFLDSLLRTRRNSQNIQNLYQRFETAKSRKRPTIIKGVHRGNYFRVTVPPKQSILPEVPKLPSPVGPALKSFKSVPPPASTTTTATEQSSSSSNVVSQASGTAAAAAAATAASSAREQASEQMKNYLDWIYAWWKENWSILTMNFGSLCTLLAFTRTDVLELRALSVSGSVCFIVYTVAQTPIRWLTVGWTTLFGSVNSYKILQIINERHSHVSMTEEQEESYEKFFMPNGITPKQFEAIEKRAQRIFVQKNEPLIKQGSQQRFVYLVIEGSTRASVMGRYLTAASTNVASHPTREVPEAGNAGAWVGEMAFLESCWGKGTDNNNNNDTANRAMYTVVAKEDCVVWRWSHEDMAALMAMSSDMNAALTRAMTSAIVGKVIGFTTSRRSARPSWQTFLDGWKHTTPPPTMAKKVAASATQIANVSAPVASLVKTSSVRRNSTTEDEKISAEDDEDVDETAKAGYPNVGSRNSSDGTPSPA